MPIMYVVGFLTFAFAYLFQKCYIIKYHRKTTSFDQDLAFDTIQFFRFSVILHLGMSAIMLTNQNILSVQDLGYLDTVNVIKDATLLD